MIQLSIGMIVKNEADKLQETLEALQPLRDAISCQLIIADTGSTDNTLEIAQAFADEAFSVVWENDFAKARNMTLDRACGEWFFYLDADEVLTDSEELIAFLTSKEQKKYNGIKIMVRSITSYIRELHQDLISPRFFRRRKEIFFQNAVHEAHGRMMPEFMLQKTLLMHSGYNNDDKELMRRKSLRNTEIMEAILQGDLNDVARGKILLDYADSRSLLGDQESMQKVKDSIEEAISLFNPLPNSHNLKAVLLARAYGLLTKMAFNTQQWEECITIGEQYWQDQIKRGPWDTDVLFFMGISKHELGEYADSTELLKQYLTMLEQGIEDTSVFLVLATPALIYLAYYGLSLNAMRSEDSEEAWQMAMKIKRETVNGVDIRKYKWELALAENSSDRLPQLYETFDEQEKQTMLISMHSAMPKLDAARKEDVLAGLRRLAADPQARVVQACYCDNQNELKEFLTTMNDVRFAAIEGAIVGQCLRFGLPMTTLLPHLDPLLLEHYINECAKHDADLADLVEQYYCHVDPQKMTLPEHQFAQLLISVSLFCTKVSAETIPKMWSLLLRVVGAYLERIYSTEILLAENRRILLPLEQFVLLVMEAEQFRALSDYATCITVLREGLAIYPQSKDAVEVVLAEIEEEINPTAAEMKRLANAVKEQIRAAIDQGNLTDAEILTIELADIIHDDQEIPLLLAQCRSSD